MSLIGPRPECPAFCAEFEKRIHGWHYRTMVTPGLSGLAQMSGGYDLLPKEKVLLDFWQAQRPALARRSGLCGLMGGLPAVRDRERVRSGRAGDAELPVEAAGAAVRAGVQILRYSNGVQ